MTIYFCVYSLVVFFSLFCSNFIKGKEKQIKWICVICFFLIFAIFAFRHETMGADLADYLPSFDVLSKWSWKEAFFQTWKNYDRGFIILNKLVGIFTSSRQLFLAICAFLSIAPMTYLIYKKSEDPLFSFMVFMGLPPFLLIFSGLRQAIALGFCALSVMYIMDRKPIPFAITIAVAILFHYTAFVFLFAYPLYHFRTGRNLRYSSILLLVVVYILKGPIFSFASILLNRFSYLDNNGAINLLLVLLGIYLFCSMFFDPKDSEQNGFLNLFFVACFCQIFGSVSNVAVRLGYYFMNILPLLLPLTINKLKNETSRKIVYITIFAVFLLYGLFALKNSSWPMSYPYYWFWQTVVR